MSVTLTLGWIWTTVLVAVAVYVIGFNWFVLISNLRGHTNQSGIPFLGGIVGAIAMATSLIPSTHAWWWIPLLIDWGGIPSLVAGLILSGRSKPR